MASRKALVQVSGELNELLSTDYLAGVNVMRSGAGVPSAGLGQDGDWYIDTTGNNLYKKASGAWTLQTSMIGPQGIPGVNGVSGASVTPFTSQTSVTVTHNFNAYPLVNVIDNTGAVIIPLTITHTSPNALTVTFTASTSGNILCSIGGVSTAVATKVADYPIVITDNLLLGNASNITLTLPTAVGNQGKIFYIKKIDASGPYLRVATTSSQTIDGQLTYDIIGQYNSMTIFSDGTNWFII